MKAPINRIIRHSFVDGPGNRTAIFFQGCNYHCTYCHNPETISLCRNCGLCVGVCPAGALAMTAGRVTFAPEKCVRCDSCLKTCPHLSSPRVRWLTAGEILAEVRKNIPFISGITVSGGECTLYPEFLEELFKGAHELGLTCLIDSNGSFDFAARPQLLAVTDGVMLDVKAADPAEYEQITGADGSAVLARAAYLAEQGKLTEVRTVCSPDFASVLTVRTVSTALAPYQQYGDIHYRIIACRPFGVREPYRTALHYPDEAFMKQLGDAAASCGMTHVSIV